MKKEYELLLVRIDDEIKQVFISDKVKRNKLAKRLPELKYDINSAVQINEEEKQILTCTERCSITIYKGKASFEKRIRGKKQDPEGSQKLQGDKEAC